MTITTREAEYAAQVLETEAAEQRALGNMERHTMLRDVSEYLREAAGLAKRKPRTPSGFEITEGERQVRRYQRDPALTRPDYK